MVSTSITYLLDRKHCNAQKKTIFNKLSGKSRHVVSTYGQIIREDCFFDGV